MVNWSVFGGTVVALAAIFAGYVYVFGLPAEMKRDLERKALKAMGENKASYVVQDRIDRIPDSDRAEVREVKKAVGNVGGGALKNPLGEAVGEGADEATTMGAMAEL